MNASQVRLMVLSAAVALGLGQTAQARSHAAPPHSATLHPTLAHAAARGAEPLSRGFHGHQGTAISFSTERRGRSVFSSRQIGFFGARHAGHGHGRSRSFARGYEPSDSAPREYGHSGGGIQCVTFARADSGIELSGNASAWWYNAQGLYQRGARPEAGSVLNFRANGSMRMGHVAVVNQVVDTRTIEIDHANWGGPGAVRGGISRDISVVDVSPGNDWSAVRVALGHSGEYGSIYPTYGFIYNRPDRGTMVAANDTKSPVPSMNPPPRDLRGASDAAYDEVAEAPDSPEPLPGRRSALGHHRRHLLSTSSHHRLHGRG